MSFKSYQKIKSEKGTKILSYYLKEEVVEFISFYILQYNLLNK